MVGVVCARHVGVPEVLGRELLLPVFWQENGGNGVAAVEAPVGWGEVLDQLGVGDGREEPHARALDLGLFGPLENVAHKLAVASLVQSGDALGLQAYVPRGL